jgi:hypothetical protein
MPTKSAPQNYAVTQDGTGNIWLMFSGLIEGRREDREIPVTADHPRYSELAALEEIALTDAELEEFV